MKILVACEESQTVTKEFRTLGHEAYSCDIVPCSGGHPEWHLQQDVSPLLEQNWDMIVAFPPCTHLAVSGAAHFKKKQADGRQQEGIDFFMKFTNLKCAKVAIENPIGIMSGLYRKPDQIIQPYFFGDTYQKSTCLWLKGLPCLEHRAQPDLFSDEVTHVEPGEFKEWVDKKTGKKKRQPKWFADAWHLKKEERAKVRSTTFPGIAKAMANQWGNIKLKENLTDVKK